jgi:hypothetical protein
MSDIYAYCQTFTTKTHYYCRDHALEVLFHRDAEALERVESGEDTSFIDKDGCSYEIIHEGTVQFEQFAGESIPLEGIFCSQCKNELYPPYGIEIGV